MRFVVVTGMSGGGKRTAMKMLEDAGYYCVDNLPIPLIDKFVELLATPNSEVTKVALSLLLLLLLLSVLNVNASFQIFLMFLLSFFQSLVSHSLPKPQFLFVFLLRLSYYIY